MNKSLLIRSIVVGFICGIALYGVFAPQTINADLNNTSHGLSQSTLVQNGRLTFCKLNKDTFGPAKKLKLVITAYSSSWDETTGIPGKPGLITASGKPVADGVVAYNHLPFGTRLRINAPGFEGRTFTVLDRTAEGRQNLDIWMSTKQDAINFGVLITDIEVEIPTT